MQDLKEFFMKEIFSRAMDFFNVHRNRKVGFLVGFIVGIAILVLGPFKTFFLFFCGVIGLYIGSRFDEEDDLVGRTLKFIEKHLPKRFQS